MMNRQALSHRFDSMRPCNSRAAMLFPLTLDKVVVHTHNLVYMANVNQRIG